MITYFYISINDKAVGAGFGMDGDTVADDEGSVFFYDQCAVVKIDVNSITKGDLSIIICPALSPADFVA